MHLEGALSPELLFRLAAKNKVLLPAEDLAFRDPSSLAERYKRFTSLDDFLHYYYIGMSVLVDASDFEELAWDYFTRAADQGVAHAELFFDPQAHLSRGVSYDVVLSGFSRAKKRAGLQFGISSELICCFLRHLPAQDGLALIHFDEVRTSLRNGDVIGIGLDSSEVEFPPELFKSIYEVAGDLGVKRTAHAGEEGPAAYIKNALDHLLVDRIDHGIRLAEDRELLKRVAEERILLSVCPISNVFLRCVDSVRDLPIRAFLEHGVRFSINSDDPAYFGGNYILDNYCAVQDAFNLDVDTWRRICNDSIQSSWCSEQRRDEMLRQLHESIKEWQPAGIV
ncbi:hypothetical protein M433DRAFT_75512 [Acidomyces richmondensis BFW]|nr:MAG: hypothetical protein FE78DRAFT_137269 [Acidomyces sp. 'richmondensis']KYG41606.1 hypothetical protein M433DRAFT_75512 [Acidomyces richmondensis BFW]